MSNLKPSFKPFLSCLLALLVSISVIAQESIKNCKKICALEKSLQEAMELSHCPGMSVVVVQKDKIIYANGFGYSDYEAKKPVTANTLFPIASCTKAFTATLIGQLEAEEKVNLDERPQKYLPELTFYNAEMNELITMRDLLAHRTGLPRHDMSWYMFPTDSRDSLIQRIMYLEPTLHVREGYQYNNLMYMVAGTIIEKVSGQSWEGNVYSHLFLPLEMNHSNLNIAELEKCTDIAYGYSFNSKKGFKKIDYYDNKGMAPVGSINSNAMDMGHWLITWINDGKYQGEQVIPAGFVREAISSQTVAYSHLPGKERPDLYFSKYGFGWELSSYRGHYRVEHGGNLNGFTSSAAFYPSDSIGIVVLVNQNYSGLPGKVRNFIADKLLGLPDGKWYDDLKKQDKKNQDDNAEEAVAAVSSRIPGTKPSHVQNDYTGKFTHPGYGSLHIALQNDSLIATAPGARFWLRHNHYDVFEPFEIEDEKIDTTDLMNLRFNFHSNIQGEIDGVYLNAEQGLDPQFFKREFEELKLNEKDLAKYTGEYDLGSAMAKVFINNENVLTLFVPGQPEYPLIPSASNKFKLKDLDGYGLEFEEEAGVIKAMLFVQPNGTFRVLKK